MSKKELWKNLGEGDVWVRVFDVKGNEVSKRVPPRGGTIQMTAEERKFNQEVAVGPDMDVFTNGKLITADFTQLVDSADEIEDLTSNSLSESELEALLQENTNTLKKKLAEIDKQAVIAALKEKADAIQEELSVAKATAIQDRYNELFPSATRQQFEDFENPDTIKPRKLQ